MRHWTEEDFTNWLYGLKDEDSHLAECGPCREESARLLAIRRQLTAEPEVDRVWLAAQRRRIYERLNEPAHHWMAARWVMSLAATVLLIIASVALLRPNRPVAPIFSHADEQLFSDLTSIEQSSEPRAIQPIHNLFEE